jgi:glycosyltransferase involved in cell wall biosynthesis
MRDAASAPANLPEAGRRVVLVHDWLTGMRGGERVLEALCRIFPDAPVLTLLHVRGTVAPIEQARRIRTSLIQWLPAPARFYRHYLPLFPMAIEGFDLDDADLVISTSHCAAKAAVPTGRATHLCYCHSPMRYAWDQFDAYFGASRVGRRANAMLRPAMAALARWDRDTAHRVHHFVANSRYVAGRIGRYYNRRASVLHPPVATDFFTPGGSPRGSYFLVVSALVPYKRIDIAIDAAREIGAPLKIVGTGPDAARLQSMAGSSVEFLGSVDDGTLRELYRGARALVLPAEEDFGIAPVEAMACGVPTVALSRGGACETVTPEVTGRLVPEQDARAFAAAMDHIGRQTFDPQVLTARAASFSTSRFEAGFRDIVTATLASSLPC